MAFQISSMTTAEAIGPSWLMEMEISYDWRTGSNGRPNDCCTLRCTSEDSMTRGTPWEVVERVRICDFGAVFRMPRNGRAPRFQERLLACPAGGEVHRLVIMLELRPLRRLPYLAHGEQTAHTRPRLIQLLGERRHVNDVMP